MRDASLYQGVGYVLGFALAAPLLHLAVGLTLDRALGNLFSQPPLSVRATGGLLSMAGLIGMVSGVVWLYRAGKGLPLSSSPTHQLVTTGPYRWSRHPIYLGATLLLTGMALVRGSFWSAVLAGPLLGVFYFSYACGVEEPVLLARFGAAYHAYQARTALFIACPFRHQVKNVVSRLLAWLSRRINRPRMWRHREHILFWGYGVWPGIGVALGLTAMEHVLAMQGLPANQVAWSVVLVTIAGLTGTRMLWRVVKAIRERVGFSRTASHVGFVSWGAAAGLLLITPTFVWITGRSSYLLVDAAFPSLMVAHVCGRIGCAFYGCCYGKETVSPLRLHYRHPALKAVREHRVCPEALLPVQLFSALYGGLTALLVFGVWTVRPLPIGVPAALSAILYGFFRLSEEWLRVQSVQFWAGLSPAHMVALGLATAGLIHLGLLPDGNQVSHAALGAGRVGAVLQQTHFLLAAGSGLLTTLVFSYHYRTIGHWRGRLWLSLTSR